MRMGIVCLAGLLLLGCGRPEEANTPGHEPGPVEVATPAPARPPAPSIPVAEAEDEPIEREGDPAGDPLAVGGAGAGGQPAPARGLDPAEIQQVVRARVVDLRKCYEAALASDPNVRGLVSVQFAIGLGGDVTFVTSTLSGSLPHSVGTCVEHVFGQMKFPKPRGGIATVGYPIVFESS